MLYTVYNATQWDSKKQMEDHMIVTSSSRHFIKRINVQDETSSYTVDFKHKDDIFRKVIITNNSDGTSTVLGAKEFKIIGELFCIMEEKRDNKFLNRIIKEINDKIVLKFLATEEEMPRNRIPAIKEMRQLFQIGLKDSKDIVDDIITHGFDNWCELVLPSYLSILTTKYLYQQNEPSRYIKHD